MDVKPFSSLARLKDMAAIFGSGDSIGLPVAFDGNDPGSMSRRLVLSVRRQVSCAAFAGL